MNYQESLNLLEEKKKWLEENKARKVSIVESWGGPVIRTELKWDVDTDSKEAKRKWELIKTTIAGYSQSLAGEVNNDKVEEVFKQAEGFTKQKEEIKYLLLTKKYFKDKGIKVNEEGKILCLIGPPGVGKTFFAGKFAEALGRKFFSINVGGENDPEVIFGSDPKYQRTKVGKIIQAIQETKSCDPVILLDEVEKSGEDKMKGTSLKDALLHVLDPEQNENFRDKFLDIPIDISQVTFILTANDEEKIPGPLKSRLEIIRLKGYKEPEKLQIGKMIIEKIFSENYDNANRNLFEMGEAALKTLIAKTKEEGVRQLKIEIKKIICWCFAQWAQQHEKGHSETKIVIDENKVNELVPEDSDKKEESEEDKLRKKIEELEEENENLKKKPLNLQQFFKPLAVGKNKEKCDKHQKTTCQTLDGNCALCELEERTKQLEAVITNENYQTIEKIWQEQKPEWIKQVNKLQDGTPEEKELSQIINSSVKKIDKKISTSRKSINSFQSRQLKKDLPWIIAGGIILLSLGYYLGWIFTKKFKKKRPRKVVQN
ncbi:MAG: AAA family ATPase [Candidatus Moeniiplasma glomeromycotorum]|nr:AAA family ATPase [Candidatus Moeniiplasma glomeromycotorum]MCE8162478.1 AAA family ATPase [Candidatus Moeniiplasma glomeromycotorum]MCE8166405.1 AAA family ATPase [Candidatus Moeniiplasma glomeromycotorum]MCE8166890.1 AAA family ATPase [Candidatus Moeniiplasma glomeromycotorum]